MIESLVQSNLVANSTQNPSLLLYPLGCTVQYQQLVFTKTPFATFPI